MTNENASERNNNDDGEGEQKAIPKQLDPASQRCSYKPANIATASASHHFNVNCRSSRRRLALEHSLVLLDLNLDLVPLDLVPLRRRTRDDPLRLALVLLEVEPLESVAHVRRLLGRPGADRRRCGGLVKGGGVGGGSLGLGAFGEGGRAGRRVGEVAVGCEKVDVSEGLQKERKVENAPRVHLSPQ
mgnify:CR=1 FL=1